KPDARARGEVPPSLARRARASLVCQLAATSGPRSIRRWSCSEVLPSWPNGNGTARFAQERLGRFSLPQAGEVVSFACTRTSGTVARRPTVQRIIQQTGERLG